MQAFSAVVAKGEVPKMADISAVLAEAGAPGEKQDEKVQVIKDLFSQLGVSGHTFQGHAVWDDLESYPEF